MVNTDSHFCKRITDILRQLNQVLDGRGEANHCEGYRQWIHANGRELCEVTWWVAGK